MKAFFAAVIGKSGYEKWKVNEPGVSYFLFYVQSREKAKKPVAGIARKESSYCLIRLFKSFVKATKGTFLYPWAELAMGRVCNGPRLLWAEFVLGRDVPEPWYESATWTNI